MQGMTEEDYGREMAKLAAKENIKVPGYTGGRWMDISEIKRRAAKAAESRKVNTLANRRKRAVKALDAQGTPLETIASLLRVTVDQVRADLAGGK